MQAARCETREEVNLDLDSQKLKHLCVLPGINKLRPGKRVYFVYTFQKRNLKYKRSEILTGAWLPLTTEENLNSNLKIVLKKTVSFYAIDDAHTKNSTNKK